MGALLDALEQEAVAIAQRYARAGVPVFPCNPLNKRPLTPHGFKEASTDLMKVRSWWAKWPQAMIGMPTGEKSGWWALDIDNDPSRGKHGLASLTEIGHDFEELADAPHSQTAGGGFHVFFPFDPDRPVTNARGRLPKHIDVRGEGGYVILAGSRTSDGRSYKWLNPWDEAERAPAPEWLTGLLIVPPEASPTPLHGDDRTLDELVRGIVTGDTYHDNLVALSARLIGSHTLPGSAVSIMRGLMEAVPQDRRDERWQDRYRDIPRAVASAETKFGYQPSPQVSVDQSDLYRVLSIDDLAALEPPEWRVDGIFTTYGSSTIYGAYESYKTFVALDLLLSLAAGRDWHGRKSKPCGVLYIAGEGQYGVAQRILGWCHARNSGVRPDLFKVLPEAVAIPQPGNLEKLLRTIDALPFVPGVVALDTITRMSGGGSLNDEKDMQQYVRGMDRLRIHTGGHVMNIGHSGKDKEKGLMGSIVLPAAMETIICVERKGEALKLINTNPKGKQKDGPNFEDIPLRAQKIEFEQAGRASSTLILMPDELVVKNSEAEPVQRLGRIQQLIMSALEQAARDGQTLGFTRLIAMTGEQDRGSLGRAVREMVARGLVEEAGTEGAKQWRLP